MKAISKKQRFIIIMAGGKGERFWPVSREKTPKQLITLLGNKSFLQEAVQRVQPIAPKENIFIITNAAQAATVRKQLPQLPAGNIIGEPCGRDTLAAVALGAALVAARDPKGVMAVLPADHVIPEPGKFQNILTASMDYAAQSGKLGVIGIQPTEPATGYGYIQFGKSIRDDQTDGLKADIFEATRFVEKPDLKTAQKYLKSGKYRWNAGMFLWSVEAIENALQKHQPEMAQFAAAWKQVASSPSKLKQRLASDYPGLTKISVDFALMEKAGPLFMADGAFDWDDLGSWPALERHLKKDSANNCIVGTALQLDSEGNIIFDNRKKSATPIALLGICNAIIVATDDAIMIADKNRAQDIKKLVGMLGESSRLRKLI